MLLAGNAALLKGDTRLVEAGAPLAVVDQWQGYLNIDAPPVALEVAADIADLAEVGDLGGIPEDVGCADTAEIGDLGEIAGLGDIAEVGDLQRPESRVGEGGGGTGGASVGGGSSRRRYRALTATSGDPDNTATMAVKTMLQNVSMQVQ